MYRECFLSFGCVFAHFLPALSPDIRAFAVLSWARLSASHQLGVFWWSFHPHPGKPAFLTVSRWSGPAIVWNSFSGTGYASPENTRDLWYQVASVGCFPPSSANCQSPIRGLVFRGFSEELLIWPVVSVL